MVHCPPYSLVVSNCLISRSVVYSCPGKINIRVLEGVTVVVVAKFPKVALVEEEKVGTGMGRQRYKTSAKQRSMELDAEDGLMGELANFRDVDLSARNSKSASKGTPPPPEKMESPENK